MDSLLATYASSDDDEESPQQNHQHQKPSNKSDPSSRFTGNSIENPKISSVFSSLPPPKTQTNYEENLINSASKIDGGQAKSSSSLFSVLPQPKSQTSDSKTLANSSSSTNPNPRKVVQFRPPRNPFLYKDDDDDDDDDEEEKRRKYRKAESLNQTPTVKSFLSSIPAPKNSSSLGSLPNSSGTGRRSILEADLHVSNSNSASIVNEEIVNSNIENNGSVDYTVNNTDSSNWGSASEHYGNYDTYGSYGDSTNQGSASEANANFESYGSYGDASNAGSASEANANFQSYGDYGHYENNWVDPPRATTDIPVNFSGKRGRTDIPHKIIEVKQDELINKNRPREDQTKLTGIAFGPSYQPVSTKGKPSKLHKRKHQIGTLYFEMRQKETELSERRSKGFLTKAETQAKYGW